MADKTFDDLIKDPDFQSLPAKNKRQIAVDFMAKDPDFQSLPAPNQDHLRNLMYAKFPDTPSLVTPPITPPVPAVQGGANAGNFRQAEEANYANYQQGRNVQQQANSFLDRFVSNVLAKTKYPPNSTPQQRMQALTQAASQNGFDVMSPQLQQVVMSRFSNVANAAPPPASDQLLTTEQYNKGVAQRLAKQGGLLSLNAIAAQPILRAEAAFAPNSIAGQQAKGILSLPLADQLRASNAQSFASTVAPEQMQNLAAQKNLGAGVATAGAELLSPDNALLMGALSKLQLLGKAGTVAKKAIDAYFGYTLGTDAYKKIKTAVQTGDPSALGEGLTKALLAAAAAKDLASRGHGATPADTTQATQPGVQVQNAPVTRPRAGGALETSPFTTPQNVQEVPPVASPVQPPAVAPGPPPVEAPAVAPPPSVLPQTGGAKPAEPIVSLTKGVNPNAVQEQTAGQGVLRTEQPAVELSQVGKGNPKPESTATGTATSAKKPEGEQKPTAEEVAASPNATGARNAITEEERAQRGQAPVDRQKYKTIADLSERAQAILRDNPDEGKAVAAAVAEKPRVLTPEEVAVLAHDRLRIKQDYRAALKEHDAAMTSGDQEAIQRTGDKVAQLEKEFNNNDDALVKGGREQSAAFNARKINLIDLGNQVEVFALARKNKGADLTPKEKASLQKTVDDYNRLSDLHQKATDQLKAVKAGQVVESVVAESRAQVNARKAADIDQKIAAAHDRLMQALGLKEKPVVSLTKTPESTPAEAVGTSTEGKPQGAGEVAPKRKRTQKQAPVVLPDQSASHVKGAAGTAFTSDNTPVKFHYAAVDSGNLITSHSDAMTENPSYDQSLQPRDRTRAASDVQVREIAQKLNPDRVGENAGTWDGAPVIGPDNQVESGNARSIAIRRNYAEGNAKAQEYRDWLKANAAKFGLDPDAIDGMKNPVLVRVREGEAPNRGDLAEKMGKAPVAAMSETETARADARRVLDLGLMDKFVPNEAGNVASLANQDFIRAFVGSLDPSERAGVLADDGTLSAPGVRRVRNAILAAAYDDTATLQRMIESTDDNVRATGNALLKVAPNLVRLKDLISRGERYDADISGDLTDAVNTLSYLRERGIKLPQYFAQGAMFDEGLSPVGEQLLTIMDKYKNSAKNLTNFINTYLAMVEDSGNPNQSVIFDPKDPPNKAEFLRAAEIETDRANANGKENPTGNIFAQNENRPGEGQENSNAVSAEAPRASETSKPGAKASGAKLGKAAAETKPNAADIEVSKPTFQKRKYGGTSTIRVDFSPEFRSANPGLVDTDHTVWAPASGNMQEGWKPAKATDKVWRVSQRLPSTHPDYSYGKTQVVEEGLTRAEAIERAKSIIRDLKRSYDLENEINAKAEASVAEQQAKWDRLSPSKPASEATKPGATASGAKLGKPLTPDQIKDQYIRSARKETDLSWDLDVISKTADRVLALAKTLQKTPWIEAGKVKDRAALDVMKQHGLLDVAWNDNGDPHFAIKGTEVPSNLMDKAAADAREKAEAKPSTRDKGTRGKGTRSKGGFADIASPGAEGSPSARFREAAPIVKELLQLHAQKGAITLDEFVRKVQEQIPELSARNIHDLLSGYGQGSEARQRSEVQQRIDSLQTESRLLSKLEDEQAGVDTRGQRKPSTASPEAQRIQAQINAIRRERDIRAQIADIQEQLRTGNLKPQEVKTKNPKSDLMWQLGDLRKELAEARKNEANPNPFSKSTAEDPAALAKLRTSLERRIAAASQRILSDNYPVTKLKKGEGPTSPEIEDLKAKLADVLAREKKAQQLNPFSEKPGIQRSPQQEAKEAKSLADQKQKVQADIDELNRQLETGNFSSKVKSAPITDDRLEALRREREYAQKKVEAAIRSHLPKTTTQKVIDVTRAFKLSGLSVISKLAGASAWHIPVEALADFVGKVPAKATVGGKRLGDIAAREGQFNASAEGKGLRALASKEALKNARDTIKNGFNQIDALAKNDFEHGGSIADTPGRLHGAEKAFLQTSVFNKSLDLRLKRAAEKGLDVNDSVVREQIAFGAAVDAQNAILKGDNAFAQWFNTVLAVGDNSHNGLVRGLSAGLHTLVPIVKVPSNYLGKAVDLTGVGGLLRGGALHGKAVLNAKKGIELPPAEADRIIQAYKYGGAGLVAMYLGLMQPAAFKSAGFYSPNAPGNKDDKGNAMEHGTLQIGGVTIPHGLAHSPFLEAVQFWATVRRGYIQSKQHGFFGKLGTSGFQAGTGLAEQAPGMSSTVDIGRAFGSENALGKMLGNYVKANTNPQLVQQAAKYLDKTPSGEPIKRQVTGFRSAVKEGIPPLPGKLKGLGRSSLKAIPATKTRGGGFPRTSNPYK